MENQELVEDLKEADEREDRVNELEEALKELEKENIALQFYQDSHE